MTRIAVFLMFALSVAPMAAAQPTGAASVVMSAASRSPSEWAQRLKSGHARLTAALADRRAKAKSHKAAVAERDREAAAIEAMKKSGIGEGTLKLALSRALSFDEKAAVAQSQLLAAEAAVARRGAELLGVYDALILDKRNEAARASKGSAARSKAVAAFRALTQRRRDIRKALLPVIKSPESTDGAMLAVRARADDDIETLLEKADLARDLEQRFWRRAESVRKRILELEAEEAIARDVIGMVQRDQLFDETDRRLFVSGNANAARSNGGAGGLLAVSRVVGGAAESDAAVPGPPSSNEAETVDTQDGDAFNGVANPADPNNTAGAVDDDTDGAGRQDTVRVTDDATDANKSGSPVPGVASVAAERALMTMLNGSNGNLDAALASGELSLRDLKRLERKLRIRARKMAEEKQKIRGRISSQTNR